MKRAGQILADARGQLAVLRAYGQHDVAAAVEAILDSLTAELHEVLTMHDEAGAVLMSGKPAGYFRSRFAGWEARGLAQYRGRGRRFYVEAIIPKRPDLVAIAAEAERAAREGAA